MSDNSLHEEELDVGRLFLSLIAGRWIILACCAIALVFAYLYLKVTVPMYVAKSLIQVEQKQGAVTAISDLDGLLGEGSSATTELQVLQSRYVLGEVVTTQQLQLNISYKYVPFFGKYLARRFEDKLEGELNKSSKFGKSYATGGEKIVIDSFFVSDELAPLSLKMVVRDAGFDIYTLAGVKLGSGVEGEAIKLFDGGVSLLVADLKANAGTEIYFSFKRIVDAANGLKKRLTISEVGRQTSVFELSYVGHNKAKIKAILANVVSAYQAQNVQRMSEEVEKSIVFLEQQIPLVRADLDVAESELNTYRTESSSLDMQFETKSVLGQLVGIDAKLHELTLRESEVSSKYKKTHPVYLTLLEQRELLLLERSKIEASVESLPVTQQKLLRLARDVEVSSEVYLQMLNKMQELRVVKAGTVGNIRILESSEVMTKPVSPNKNSVMFLAVFIGGVIGVVIVIIQFILDKGMRDPLEIQNTLGTSNYGVVPESKLKNNLDDKQQKSIILSKYDPKDLALEAIRGIRTSLHFAMMDSKNNIVMISGPSPGIGKSFICTNLATLLAESGKKVLLIDADMRRGKIHEAFDLPRSHGLSDVVSRGMNIEHTIQRQVVDNLDLVTTGSIPPNPSELLMSQNFSMVVEYAQSNYDIVLIDTPPTLAVSDALIIGERVGTILTVVRHNRNSLREFEQMNAGFNNVGLSVKGYVYNFMNFSEAGYKYGNKYYEYGYYGIDEEGA